MNSAGEDGRWSVSHITSAWWVIHFKTHLKTDVHQLLSLVCLSVGVLHSLCLHGQYILIQTNKTWNDAEAYCIENHLSLALIPNQSDLDIFREIMSDTNFSQAWMGLSVDVNSWRWSYQNENLTFTKWSSGEPNNAGGSEECGSMFKYGNDVLWNDANCYAHLNCVCFHGTYIHY